jgi:hypothetical protein
MAEEKNVENEASETVAKKNWTDPHIEELGTDHTASGIVLPGREAGIVYFS